MGSAYVEVECITDQEVEDFRAELSARIKTEPQISNAVAQVFAELAAYCPDANPSDLWHHVIYRHLLTNHISDQQWKRISGYALERALVMIYQPRLTPRGVRMRILKKAEADRVLVALGIEDIRSTKVDLFLEGLVSTGRPLSRTPADEWWVFGAAHVKSSIAERIQDDVPASRALMNLGLTSIALTMDAKSYPPPHGVRINYGELGGRSMGVEKERIKRRYVENDGQFDGLFSFNLRTPPSADVTPSTKRIYTMSLNEPTPDQLVTFIENQWQAFTRKHNLTISQTKA